MKKLLLFAVLTIFIGCQNLWASQADDFKVDQQQVQTEFADLNQLEQTVLQNNFMSLSEMQSKNMLSSKYSNLNLTNGMMMEPALGIPGFWWGCVFGPVGILIVYLVTDNDKAEVKKSLYGCLVSGAFWIVWEVFWLVVYGNSFLI